LTQISAVVTKQTCDQGSIAGVSGSAAAQPAIPRLSVDGAPPGAKRQLWTLTLMAADAVHETSLPGALTEFWRLQETLSNPF
jgi:hypothetical protein